MIIESACAPPFLKNGFVVSCERTKEAVYIDPGDEVAELLDYIAREQLKVGAILLTHAHIDHVSGVAAAKRALGAPIWLHRDDRDVYARAQDYGALFGYQLEQPPPPDHWGSGITTCSSITHRDTAPATCACRSAGAARRAWICSSATRCSPGRSGARTCPAGTTSS
jgi:glyoxylase-like metal-dependent hydrolase (beta-lactamase superfamily II)